MPPYEHPKHKHSNNIAAVAAGGRARPRLPPPGFSAVFKPQGYPITCGFLCLQTGSTRGISSRSSKLLQFHYGIISDFAPELIGMLVGGSGVDTAQDARVDDLLAHFSQDVP